MASFDLSCAFPPFLLLPAAARLNENGTGGGGNCFRIARKRAREMVFGASSSGELRANVRKEIEPIDS